MVAAPPPVELQDLGSLAKEMEDQVCTWLVVGRPCHSPTHPTLTTHTPSIQLVHEFESLLAARRKQDMASSAKGSSSSSHRGSSSQAAMMAAAVAASTGGKDQDARDALYWKHMYERLRDLRETDAERLLRETAQHAEEREKSLLDLIAHLEAGGGGGGKGGKGSAKMDVRLSDVSVLGGGSAPMDLGEVRSSRSSGGEGSEAQAERIAVLEDKLGDLKRVLMAYQRFTSLCVTLEKKAPVAGGVSKLSCTAINHVHKKAVKFSLKMNVDVEDNLGMDATFRPVANKELLPTFLQQEATLETKQCPILLLSILKTLFDEKKGGKGKE